MKPKAILTVAGVVTFLALGVYLAIVQGVEPSLPACSKFSLVCRR